MYLEFFGLKGFPFENDFNNQFFFQSKTHKEAYSRIEYVIENRKLCGVITGAYGCGKTYILKLLMKNLSKKGYVFSEVINPIVDDLGILKLIAYNFLNYKLPQTKADIMIALEKFLKDTSKDAKHCVVLIDEAQNINDEKVFEELRMLLNYTFNDKPLVSLILCGQTELREKITSNKQFIQRVYISYDIKPFDAKETENYISHRLSVVGGTIDIFEDSALEYIYSKTGGIPRRINSICDIALLTAFSKNVKNINTEILEEAYLSISGDE